MIYVDYAKAFDEVFNNIMVAKIERYGIKGKVLKCIQCFLMKRYQTVVVDGNKSHAEK